MFKKVLLFLLSVFIFCDINASIIPYSAVITNAVNEFTLDMGTTNTIDGIFTTGTNYIVTPSWPNTTGFGTNPIGTISVYIGNTSPATTFAGLQWVPYDACFSNGVFNVGDNLETQASIHFSPLIGRYVTLLLQTNQNWFSTNNNWVLVSPPATLKWDCYTNQIHGCVGTNYPNLDAVVAATTSVNGGLLQDSSDLSYYLSELEGKPVPIILSSQTNSYPGVIYRVIDLQNLAPNYAAQQANILNGTLPTNITVNVQGTREVDFTGWPYMDVWFGVITFLEKQGVRWVYADEDGDYIPYGNGVSLSSLPYNFSPSVRSIYANFSVQQYYPWSFGIVGPTRQGYLYWWRNHWTSSENGFIFSGNEIQKASAPGGLSIYYSTNNSEFSGYPHNYNNVVPSSILELTNQVINGVLVDTNWWGYRGGQYVNPTTGVYDGSPYQLTWSQTSSNLIKWVAQKMIAVDTSNPLDSISPLTYKQWSRYYGILPIDATLWSTNQTEVSLDSPLQPAGDGWVNAGGAYSYSPQYYYLITNVAYQVTQLGGNQTVMGLAYANVNAAPPNFNKFPSNIHMQVCVYGQPVLSTASPQNISISNNWVAWNNLTTNLGVYDYQLLLTDFSQQNPLLPVPEVSGMVDRAKFLQNEGVFEAGCQATPNQIIDNPWDYYAYPRVWWDKTQTASNLLSEFFTGFYNESASPMLNFYNIFEQNVTTNNIGMHGQSSGYAESILPGTFTFPVLYAMQTNLNLAFSDCTTWITLQRLNVISNQFAWVIGQMNLTGVNLNDPTIYTPVPTNSIFTLFENDFTKLQTRAGNPYLDASSGNNYATTSNAGIGATNPWTLQYQESSIQKTFNFTNSGYYRVIVNGGYGYLGNPGLCRVTIGNSSAPIIFTNDGSPAGYIHGYTNFLSVKAGANVMQIDSFNETNNAASPGVIYTASIQYLLNTAPTATFAASTPTSGAYPLTVNFNYTGTNGTSFLWNFGDGYTSTSENVSHTYDLAATNTVTLVVNGMITNSEAGLVVTTNGTFNPTNYLYQLSLGTNGTSAYAPASGNASSTTLWLGTNSTLWTAPTSLACVGYASAISSQCCLVASNLVFISSHVNFSGKTLTFHDTNGTGWFPVVTNQVLLGDDFGIGQLDRSAPASIPLPYLFSTNSINKLQGKTIVNYPAFWAHNSTAQIEYMYIDAAYDGPGVNTGSGVEYGSWISPYANVTQGQWAASYAVSGDSSSPIFTMYDTNLVLLGAMSGTGGSLGGGLTTVGLGVFYSGYTNFSILQHSGLTNGLQILNLGTNITSVTVTDFGAIGDAIQFSASCVSNSSLIVTTSSVPNTAIGDNIEIYNAGPITPLGINSFGVYTNGYYDLIATITNIVHGTNVYISQVCSNTINNAFTTYGYDNETAINSALSYIYASGSPNVNLLFPAGNYLILSTNTDLVYAYCGVFLRQGWINIIGAGTNNTRLIGQGARVVKPIGSGSEGNGFFPPSGQFASTRGIMFDEINIGVFSGTNTPLTIQSINIDGGIPNVATRDNYNRNDGFFMNPIDGMGLDETHSAIEASYLYNSNGVPSAGSTYYSCDFSIYCTNTIFDNWAGEVLKNPNHNTNANVCTYYNNVFYDDRFDGVNIGQVMVVSNNVFDTVGQPIEMYTASMTSPTYFEDNLVTNCFGECAIGFSRGYNNIPFVYFINNTCYYFNPSQGNMFLNLNHLVNCVVSNNYFCDTDPNGGNGEFSIVTGSTSGEIAFTCQSNILVLNNTFVDTPFMIGSWNGLTTFPANDIYHSDTIIAGGNKMINTNTSGTVIGHLSLNYGWTTNCSFNNNDCSQFNSIGGNSVYVFPTLYNFGLTFDSSLPTNLVQYDQVYTTNGLVITTNNVYTTYPLVSTNNTYWTELNTGNAVNYISYGFGSKFYQIGTQSTILINSDSNCIPSGAQITMFNDNLVNFPLYLNNANGTKVTVTNQTAVTLNWSTNNVWVVAPTTVIYFLPFQF
jgi:hypothetical protein